MDCLWLQKKARIESAHRGLKGRQHKAQGFSPV
jgi:hypothetical protein